MLQRLFLSGAILIAALSVAASAQSTIPEGVNLHNGFVEVRNEIVIYRDGRRDVALGRIHMNHANRLGYSEVREAHTGQTAVFNKCCVLAGSPYTLEMDIVQSHIERLIYPRLCNVRGIPFGYAVVVFRGEISIRDHYSHATGLHAYALDVPCPTR